MILKNDDHDDKNNEFESKIDLDLSETRTHQTRSNTDLKIESKQSMSQLCEPMKRRNDEGIMMRFVC